VVAPRQRRRTEEFLTEGPVPEGKIEFEATLGTFVSTRDGNLVVNLIVPGREASEIAKVIRLYGYRIHVEIEARRSAWLLD
jgi:hypothetical protein